jgi:indolepyruvate ferredoxin oxidoreductase, beta subunit
MSEATGGQPYSILIAALGGEGGGVLMGWIVAAARRAGLVVQATSVPGVAQRTGATSYYVEMLRQPQAQTAQPVFALSPMPGEVDVVIASELVEAGRMMERGFVSPRRTTLVSCTSRTYTTLEKAAAGDGRFEASRIEAAAARLARRFVALDLTALARTHGTVVSATMFGALAGAGLLPWPRETSLAALGDERADRASVAGFEAAHDAVSDPAAAAPAKSAGHPADARLAGLPIGVRDIAALGLDRCIEFQDCRYGELYLERLQRLVAAAGDRSGCHETGHALVEAARRLALWMAYEDVARVADLKSRPERFRRIHREAGVQPGQVVSVTDYLKPGAEELAAVLPEAAGRWVLRRAQGGRKLPFLGRGLKLRSTGICGYLVLRLLARFRRLRPASLRYREEQSAIEDWLTMMAAVLPRDPAFAGALAELPRLLKGYGETLARGREAYRRVMDGLVRPAVAAGAERGAAPLLRRAIGTAMADPEHSDLDTLLASTQPGLPSGRGLSVEVGDDVAPIFGVAQAGEDHSRAGHELARVRQERIEVLRRPDDV